MKKMMILMLLAMSFSVMAGPEHKGHGKNEMNLTDEQRSAWKALKNEKHEQMMAAKKDIYADYDERLAEILDDEQMAQYKKMREHKGEHKMMKKHKMKHKKRMKKG